jgi:hypothetical protein
MLYWLGAYALIAVMIALLLLFLYVVIVAVYSTVKLVGFLGRNVRSGFLAGIHPRQTGTLKQVARRRLPFPQGHDHFSLPRPR